MVGFLTFPSWLRATHFLTMVFISPLIRSGLEILSGKDAVKTSRDAPRPEPWVASTERAEVRSAPV